MDMKHRIAKLLGVVESTTPKPTREQLDKPLAIVPFDGGGGGYCLVRLTESEAAAPLSHRHDSGAIGMDPNATLKRIFDAVDAHEWEDAFWALRELKLWLAQGGFAPEWKTHKPRYISLGDDDSPEVYSLLSNPTNTGAVLIRYRFSEESGRMEECESYQISQGK